jgi:hypothetical protein
LKSYFNISKYFYLFVKYFSLKKYFNSSKIDISHALGLKFPKSPSLNPTH